MNKKSFFIGLCLLLVASALVFAVPSVSGNTYAVPGTDITMSFRSGEVSFAYGGERWTGAGTYRISGDRLTLSLQRTNNAAFKELSGGTYVFRILDNGDLDESGSRWVRR